VEKTMPGHWSPKLPVVSVWRVVVGMSVLGVGGFKPSQTFSHWQDHQPQISKVSQIWSKIKMFFETTNQILLIFNEIGSCWGILVGCFRAHMIF
jgi:hypothetical protein